MNEGRVDGVQGRLGGGLQIGRVKSSGDFLLSVSSLSTKTQSTATHLNADFDLTKAQSTADSLSTKAQDLANFPSAKILSAKARTRLAIFALEPSANIHLAKVLEALVLERFCIDGIYSSDFIAPLVGNAPLYDLKDFAVMGFLDVLKRARFLKHAQNEAIKLAKRSDKVLLMDSSSFNIKIAKEVKRAAPHVKVYYYILPQVWAWKRYRYKILQRYCDFLLGILPFEIEVYKDARVFNAKSYSPAGFDALGTKGLANICYIGHPLLDELQISPTTYTSTARLSTQPSQDASQGMHRKKIVFMPGSRRGEIERLLPIYKELLPHFHECECALVIPPNLRGSEEEVYKDVSHFTLYYEINSALRSASFAFICSGTATLEAALLGVPFVLCYKGRALDFYIAKTFVKIDYIGLANILYERGGLYEDTVEDEAYRKSATSGEMIKKGAVAKGTVENEPGRKMIKKGRALAPARSFTPKSGALKASSPPAMLHIELLQGEVTAPNLLAAYASHDAPSFRQGAARLYAYLGFGAAQNVAKLLQD